MNSNELPEINPEQLPQNIGLAKDGQLKGTPTESKADLPPGDGSAQEKKWCSTLSTTCESVNDLINTVNCKTDLIMVAFNDKIAYDKFKDEQVRRLHDELQSYKSDLLTRAIQPFVMGMIMIHEDIGKALESIHALGADDHEFGKIIRFVEAFREDIETLLIQNGINTYREESNIFNGKRQRVLRKVPTPDPESVGRIVQSLRPGFERNDSIIQKEAVAVYVAA
jgi:molecular chaperone GrpE